MFSVPSLWYSLHQKQSGAGEHLTRLFGPPSAFEGEVQGLLLDDSCNHKSKYTEPQLVEPGGNLGESHVGKVVSQGNQEVFWEHKAPEITSHDHLLTRREEAESISSKMKSRCHSTGIEN